VVIIAGKVPSPVSVTVAPEWGVYPLWIEYTPGELRDNVSPELLSQYGVDQELILSLDSWDESYQAVYNPDDPVESGFEDENQTKAWIAEGIALTRKLSTQLPLGVTVKFRKIGEEVRFTAPSDKEDSTL
jgi:hypothetical protein